jgi:arginase
VFTAREIGVAGVIACTHATLDRTGWPFWLHFDVDVLDQAIMPAVDSPGSPGIDPADLVALLRRLVNDARCAGLTVTIYDPSLDPAGTCARRIVALLRDVFA